MSSEAFYLSDALANTDKRQSDGDGARKPHSVLPRTIELSKELARPTQQAVISDEALMEQIRGGEREALGQLFRLYARAVRNVAIRILRDEAEADDLVQEVFLFVFRKADLYNPEKGTALTWIFRVTYHRAFDRRRYLIARKFYLSQEIEPLLGRLEDPRQEIRFNVQSWEGVLGEKMADRFRSRLTPEQQETLQLFFFEGYALKEIAELTGRSLVNVRSHYYRGLERLRQYVLPQNKRSK